ncbi:MAG: esterase family protein [Alistipes sp.]|nr:esterase family protein [Alistipes sp.]
MKRFLFLLPFLTAFAVAVQAQGRLEQLSVKSELLGVEKVYSIYLPEGYDASDERYPVLYLLHGAYGNHRSWCRDGGGELPRIANEEIAAGRVRKMIVVMPDATGLGERRGGKNMGYFNVDGWPYEDFFFQEFIPHIDKTFKTIATKEGRAVAGLSMGGGGSVVYAQRHHDHFCACYSTSGLLDHYYRARSPYASIEWLWSVAQTSPVEYVRHATAEQLEQLHSVRWMADCGDDDFLMGVNMEFFAEMKRANIPLEFRVRDGVHDWKFWRASLPQILQFCFPKE